MAKMFLKYGTVCFILLLSLACSERTQISLSCREDNDLFKTLVENQIPCIRYDTPADAVNNAAERSAVMILADNYPEKTTVVDGALFEKAQSKNLRLYVEYPSSLPGWRLENQGEHTGNGL